LKILKFVLIFLAAGAVFYFVAIFLGFNLPKPALMERGIEGNAELKVTLLMDNNVRNPLPNIEVDLAEKPGQPPKGGVAITNEQGVATFKVKPGSYFIYFNEVSFPKNLSAPEPQAVTVAEGSVNEKTLLVGTGE
jgi:hypothetical protein